MLLAIKVLIGLITEQFVEWLAAIAAGALDKGYTFPFGLISSEGVYDMVAFRQ